jgi:sorting nexin-8
MFLTVPTELAVWRKQATISVSEEFVGKPLPPGLEDSLPANLEELFETVRSGVRRSAETYINLSNQMERLTKRNEGIAAEYARFSTGLITLTQASKDTYGLDTNDVPLLNEGLSATARHLNTSRSLLEDEAKAWDEGVLEDLKKQRDCLVSVRDMFERRDKYDRDNIPQLERRIASNENKLSGLRNRPEGQGKPGDIEKVEDAILKVRLCYLTLSECEHEANEMQIGQAVDRHAVRKTCVCQGVLEG